MTSPLWNSREQSANRRIMAEQYLIEANRFRAQSEQKIEDAKRLVHEADMIDQLINLGLLSGELPPQPVAPQPKTALAALRVGIQTGQPSEPAEPAEPALVP